MTMTLPEAFASAVPQRRSTNPRPARFRGRTRIAAVVVPVLLLVGWGVVLPRQVLLESVGGYYGVEGPRFVLQPQEVLSNGLGDDYLVTTPAMGSRLGISVHLQNTGRLPVQLLEVGIPFPDYYLDQPRMFASDGPAGLDRPSAADGPVTVPAGESREVGVSWRMKGCETGPVGHSAGTMVAASVPVTWRRLGRTTVTELPISFRASLAGLPGCRPV